MPDTAATYTADQISTAARDLRDAAGSMPDEPTPGHSTGTGPFTLHQAVTQLSGEIRLLRERGFTDDRIADLFTSFDIEATSDMISRFYSPLYEPE